MPSDGAKLYKGPIAISDRTVINVAAFDQGRQPHGARGRLRAPGRPGTPPDAPTGLTGTAGQQQVALRWNAGDPSRLHRPHVPAARGAGRAARGSG
jgi:hypothetical protein